MKKQITLSVLLLLMLAQLASCGSEGSPNDITTPDGTESNVPEETRIWRDSLPEQNFEGKTFTIAIYENADARNHVFSNEQTGDLMNDAIYEATLNVSQRFNVKLEQLIDESDAPGSTADTKSFFRNNVMAGDAPFHVSNTRAPNALSFYAEELIIPFDELEYIDLSQPYWADEANAALTINGVHYTALGDMNISAYDLTHVLLFNENLIKNYKLESPFDLVESGKWTFDKMSEMMTAVSSDLNGDGAFDESDQYGYSSYFRVAPQNFWIAGGIKSVIKDEADCYQLNLSKEKTVDYLTKLVENLMGETLTYFNDVNGWYDAMPDWEIEMFKNDRVLFANSTLRYMESLRDMNTDFGIIPYPKQDEAQENYYVRLGYWNAPLVPVTNQETEMTGVLLEALNAEYSRVVRPKFFDTALKGKIARNEESERMLDLILDSRTIDVGDVLFSSTIRATINDVFQKGSTDFMSSIEANRQTNEKAIIDGMPKSVQ
ncbi:MAG: hypothetical protein IKD07_03320 [Clostridia bacterium]|nr:hypothetical protein [Clostridia bacterium]